MTTHPSMLPGKYTWLSASDLDGDADPDIFRGGKIKNGKLKLAIVGHDGSPAAIQKYKDETAELLQSGAIAEMSGAIAHIMITRYGVPAVTTKEEVESNELYLDITSENYQDDLDQLFSNDEALKKKYNKTWRIFLKIKQP